MRTATRRSALMAEPSPDLAQEVEILRAENAALRSQIAELQNENSGQAGAIAAYKALLTEAHRRLGVTPIDWNAVAYRGGSA